VTAGDWLRQVVPLAHLSSALNPSPVFARYDNAASEVERASPGRFVSTLLDEARRMFDEEGTRRDGINARAGVLLGTSGVLGGIIVAGGQIVLGSSRPSLSMLGEVAVGFYIASILYVGLGIVQCLKVQSVGRGNLLGPDDLPPLSTPLRSDKYQLQLAGKLVRYTIANYRLSNEALDRLQAALKCVRNGLIALLVVGLMIPWSTTATKASSNTPIPCQPSAHHWHQTTHCRH
jgi:hypothetical protein